MKRALSIESKDMFHITIRVFVLLLLALFLCLFYTNVHVTQTPKKLVLSTPTPYPVRTEVPIPPPVWTNYQAPVLPDEGCVPFAKLRHVWRIHGEYYAEESVLPRLCNLNQPIHKMPETWHQNPPNVSIQWLDVVTVIQHRIYPGAFAHDVHNTLAGNLMAIFRFLSHVPYEEIPQKMRELYLDGVQVQHSILSALSDYPVTQSSLPDTDIFFEYAMIGHYKPGGWCHQDESWNRVSEFLSHRLCNQLVIPKDPRLVWFVNRNPGAGREVLNHDDIVSTMRSKHIEVVDTRPGTLSFQEQVCLARRASVLVGPHGANLAMMILAGKNTSTIEIISPQFDEHYWWLYAYCSQNRWFSFRTGVEPEGDARSRPDAGKVVELVQQVLQNRSPVVCAKPCDKPHQQVCEF